MASPADTLFALDAEFSLTLDAFTADFARTLEPTLRALRLRVNALIRQMEREDGRVVQTQVNLGLAQRALATLEATLVQAGYEQSVTAAYARLPRLVRFTGLSEAARAFSAFDLATVEAFRVVKARELTDLFTTGADKASQVLLKGVMGAQDEGELLAELEDLLNETAAHARTLYETGLSEFVQTMTALHSDGTPDEAFLFSGPIDARIRPFCLAHVGRVYTRKAIDAMNNGMLNNTFISRGGYNCRHMWHRVANIDALKATADTGAFSSERARFQVEGAEAAAKAIPRRERKAA